MQNTNLTAFIDLYLKPTFNVESLKDEFLNVQSTNLSAFKNSFLFAQKLQKLHEFLLNPTTKQIAKTTYNYDYKVADVLSSIFGIGKSQQSEYIQFAKGESKIDSYISHANKTASKKNVTAFYGIKDFLNFVNGKPTKHQQKPNGAKESPKAKETNESESGANESPKAQKPESIKDSIKSLSLSELKELKKLIEAEIKARPKA